MPLRSQQKCGKVIPVILRQGSAHEASALGTFTVPGGLASGRFRAGRSAQTHLGTSRKEVEYVSGQRLRLRCRCLSGGRHPSTSLEPLPSADLNTVVIRTPREGLSLAMLRDSPVGKELMEQADWLGKHPWSAGVVPAGTYHLRFHEPFLKTADAQDSRLWVINRRLAPPALVAAALLCIQRQEGVFPSIIDLIRCEGRSSDDNVVVLYTWEGLLQVGTHWSNFAELKPWLATLRII
jgi:hypothetical protein